MSKDDWPSCRNIRLRIAERREELGLSQDELSKRARISRQMISEYETGGSLPTLPVLGRIAEALDCHMKDLLIE